MGQTVKKLAPLPPIGAYATLSRVIAEHDIELFAEVSGDKNPIHLDAGYAERSILGSVLRMVF